LVISHDLECQPTLTDRVPGGRQKGCFLKPALGDLLQPRRTA
jgi:hypothetical protein